MTTTHTPGPWALNLPATTEIVADLGGADLSIAQHVRNRADARLIAAAPDLLAAAIDALETFERRFPDSPTAHDLRAAIARATKGD